MKSQHSYRGYVGAWKWPAKTYFEQFLLSAVPLLAYPALFLKRQGLRIAAVYLVPTAVTFTYLATVTQIMGFAARYYIPFIAPVAVSALWMSDMALESNKRQRQTVSRVAIATILAVCAFVINALWKPAVALASLPHVHEEFRPARLVTLANSELPAKPWYGTVKAVTDIVTPLPSGSLVAASEVGLIGAAAPQVNIINLAGLNDNQIALTGFSMERLLERKPLIIWFPHADYTWQRRSMFCSPDLLKNYILIGGDAFNYSLAVRRNTEETAQVLQATTQAFQQMYPGVNMADYVVSAIKCD